MTVFDAYIIFMTAFGILTRFVNFPQWVANMRLMIGFAIGLIFFYLNIKSVTEWGVELRDVDYRAHSAAMLFGSIFITSSFLKKFDIKYGGAQEKKDE